MKESNTVQSEFADIIGLLRNALHIGKYMDMRSRFANEYQWKDEEPRLKEQAYAAWMLAKMSIGDRRDELESYLRENRDKYGEDDVNNFIAAIQVIDKEVQDSFEREILKEDEMSMVKTKWEDDQLLLDEEEEFEGEELDEDEAYVRETSGTIDDEDEDLDEDEEDLELTEEDEEF